MEMTYMEVSGRSSQRNTGTRRTARLLAAAAVGVVALGLAAGPAAAQDFSNNTEITTALPGPPPGCPFPSGCPSEKASPYPSTIAVSGLSGTVSDVNVVLRDLTYPLKPADADIMVVAPGGRAVILMSDACGDNSDANENPVSSPITLTFDDEAAALLPADGVCTTGSFRPVDDDDDAEEFGFHMQPDDTFTDGPAAPAGTQPLSSFDGIDANGTWSLYLVDDGPNDPNASGTAGRIGGWTLSVNNSGSAAQVTTTTVAGGTQATTTTTAPRATTSTTRATTATTAPSGTTTTTKAPLATSGRNSGPMTVVAALFVAAGLAMVRAAGPQQRRRRRHRKPMVYIVSWH